MGTVFFTKQDLKKMTKRLIWDLKSWIAYVISILLSIVEASCVGNVEGLLVYKFCVVQQNNFPI